MKTHHTKEKGDLGLMYAQLDLCKKGFKVFLPTSEHTPFDLIAYKDYKCYRIQVKYRQKDKFGAISIKFASCWADKHGSHTSFIDKQDVDYWCFYCPDTNECYYINPNEFKKSITLRIDEAKQHSNTNEIHYCQNYRDIKITPPELESGTSF